MSIRVAIVEDDRSVRENLALLIDGGRVSPVWPPTPAPRKP